VNSLATIALDIGIAGLDPAFGSSLPYGIKTAALAVISILLMILILYDLTQVNRDPEDPHVRAYLDELLLVLVPLLLTFLSYVLFVSLRILN